ncbi:HAD family hydrolase [Undibacterium sp. RTI2.1]|uniref:HAD family hydrolase n=1 Tax=unclassified Undibacterium TaxID=2630295 RepID=UPI002AB3F721|nr:MULTISPECIES: HAD family hydrolase [unclassified Undibacterium]MDY7537405.1 HAD family hydrolase [Undibacterium sp. 5I1]MEB0031210.1 HAD family hydrolase [Undibacterium sp. RTI2.1]MEB0117590.1 HAD family hydrolase [Undibacterium sp. RTI2.2]MEB0232275.1 HAD family hydrolase [Undibacterium sp. 10I3]MEB0259708.1 HAD family hydrolase [Undibacterium sp. 5I1]
MAEPDEIIFLLDVDNTLLDNDRLRSDLRCHLSQEFGPENEDRYNTILEELREELGYVDYLGALQRYRVQDMSDPRLLLMSAYLMDFPFSDLLYPNVKAAISHLSTWGKSVILSDGDVVFQPRKIQRSGLWNAVAGRVLVYVHKEDMLDVVEAQYPAQHYVMVDDKLRILSTMKSHWGDRLTTIFVRQGHYALDPENIANFPAADVTIDHTADLIDIDFLEVIHAPKSSDPP